jgi:CheY-like chemotaxis protein
MKILLIEDEEDKRAAIARQVRTIVGSPLVLTECASLRSGLKEIIEGIRYDLVLLDMSMPGFDASIENDSSAEEPESFAGKELMSQMKLRGICMPVLVVTQYKAFAKGTIGLEELTLQCESEFGGMFCGAIYYSTAVESWKRELLDIITRLQSC